jgi:hypothetical protein
MDGAKPDAPIGDAETRDARILEPASAYRAMRAKADQLYREWKAARAAGDELEKKWREASDAADSARTRCLEVIGWPA